MPNQSIVNSLVTIPKSQEPVVAEFRLHLDLFKRIVVVGLLFYLLFLVYVGRNVQGTLWDFYWTRSGWSLFPIPTIPRLGYAVITYLNPVDIIVYLLFVANWIWVLWATLACLYLLEPLSQRLKIVARWVIPISITSIGLVVTIFTSFQLFTVALSDQMTVITFLGVGMIMVVASFGLLRGRVTAMAK